MPYFTIEDKQFFEKNGYIIKYNTVPDQLIQRAIDVIWEHIDADHNDPETWINAGQTGNLPCTNLSSLCCMMVPISTWQRNWLVKEH